jgi:hypothetical protein
MHTYKSYIRRNSAFLLENEQKKTSQILGLESMIADDIVKSSTWTWNEKENWIDFDSDLTITHKFNGENFLSLPFKIGWVEGDFVAKGVDTLKNLIGSPKSTYGFDVSYCSLKSLEGSPQSVYNFIASHNLIRSLSESPRYVLGDFNTEENMLKSLDSGPYIITGTITTGFKKEESVLFKEMHKDIRNQYLNVVSWDKTINSIEKAIYDKTYVPYVIGTNPKYSKFMGSFPGERDELGFMGNAQDYGLI